MPYNMFIFLWLWKKNYIFLLHYHFNSFLQVNFNWGKIYSKGFPNFNTCLHLFFINITLSQCTTFNIHLHVLLHLLSFQTSFIHDTTHAICQFSWGVFLLSNNPSFFLGLHLPKLQKPQNKIKQTFLPTLENKYGTIMRKQKQ